MSRSSGLTQKAGQALTLGSSVGYCCWQPNNREAPGALHAEICQQHHSTVVIFGYTSNGNHNVMSSLGD